MLNHESTSIARETQEQNDEYKSTDVSAIKYSKKSLIVEGVAYPVTTQRPSYYEGKYVVTFNNVRFDAYSIKNLKAMIADEIEYCS